MPGIATLIMWAATGIFVIGFLAWGNNVLGHHYKDPLISEHKAETTSLNSVIDSQKRTIGTQGASLATVTRQAGECSASIVTLRDIAKARGDEADVFKAKAAQARARVQPRIDADANAAAGPPSSGTCEQQMQEIRAIGDEYAREVFGFNK